MNRFLSVSIVPVWLLSAVLLVPVGSRGQDIVNESEDSLSAEESQLAEQSRALRFKKTLDRWSKRGAPTLERDRTAVLKSARERLKSSQTLVHPSREVYSDEGNEEGQLAEGSRGWGGTGGTIPKPRNTKGGLPQNLRPKPKPPVWTRPWQSPIHKHVLRGASRSDLGPEESDLDSSESASDQVPDVTDVVDVPALCAAWRYVDADGLCTAAEQLAHAERSIATLHPVLLASSVRWAAARAASIRRDVDALKRILASMKDTGASDPALTDYLQAQIKLASSSRDEEPVFMVSVQDTSPEDFQTCRDIIQTTHFAHMAGDPSVLDQLYQDLQQANELPLTIRDDLIQLAATTREALDHDEALPDPNFRGLLNELATDSSDDESLAGLADESRGWGSIKAKISGGPGPYQKKIAKGMLEHGQKGYTGGTTAGSYFGPKGAAVGGIVGGVGGAGYGAWYKNHQHRKGH